MGLDVSGRGGGGEVMRVLSKNRRKLNSKEYIRCVDTGCGVVQAGL